MICVNYVTVSPKEIILKQGSWADNLTVEVCPASATCRNIKWSSRNPEIATVNEKTGAIRAADNAVGKTKIYAKATDGSGRYATVHVTVEEETSIRIDKLHTNGTIMIQNSEAIYYAIVLPERVAKLDVVWKTSNSNVLYVKSVDPDSNSAVIAAKNPGDAVLTVATGDGRKEMRYNFIVEERIHPNSVVLDPCNVAMDFNSELKLNGIVQPDNANDALHWSSDNTRIATVDSNGKVTSKNETGSAEITLRIGTKTASCKVTVVDPDKKVIVTKENDIFYHVYFSESDVTWKSICCDLETEDSHHGPDPDGYSYEYRRYRDNRRQIGISNNSDNGFYKFTADELALLYRFDPLGVEFYVKHGPYETNVHFKDTLYKKIFVIDPNRFYFTLENREDGSQYPSYILNGKRTGPDIYSNAEILFGLHAGFDLNHFMPQFLEGLFHSIPGVSRLTLGMDVSKALFHAGSLTGILRDQASSYVRSYVEGPANQFVKDILGKERIFALSSWCANLLQMATTTALNNFIMPNPHDLEIYKTIETFRENNKFSVVYSVREIEVAMDGFMPHQKN